MEIETKKTNNAVIIIVKGRMDAVTVPELEAKTNALIEEGAICIILNFNHLEYISSAGLRVVLITAKKLKVAKGQLLLTNLTGIVKEVFEMSGLLTIFKSFTSDEEALKQI